MTRFARPDEGKPNLKGEAAQKDPAYIRDLHELPCVICDAFGEVQLSATAAHHWIMERFGNLRTPDREAIPLCEGHHQGAFDTSKVAIHKNPKRWRELYGADHDYIKATQNRMGI